MSETDATDRVRYARHLALPQIGEQGQRRLATANVLLVGLGGLGAPAALYLANSGIGHLLINDFDRVDPSNLPRQLLFRHQDVGEFKTHAAAARLAEWNPQLKVSVLNRRLAEDELADAIAACDLVLDGSDNFGTRMQINAVCARSRTPLVSGAAIRFEGQLTVFRHAGGGPCYQCLYGDADESLEDCAGQGVLAPVAGTIGCMMATEAIKLLVNLPSELDGRLWVYDALAGNARSIAIRPRPDCPVCGR